MAETNVYGPAEIVTMAWDRAQAMSSTVLTRTDNYYDIAKDAADESATMQPAAVNFEVQAEEPDVYIPSKAEGNLLVMFGDQWGIMMDDLADKFEGFITKFMPDDCGTLKHAQDWICKVLTVGGTGMTASVEDQIWQRDRSRILRDGARREADTVAGFAARGFPLPPGVAVAALQRIREDVDDKVAQSSRDVAIKQAEIEIENVRFSVDKAILLRTSVMDAARGYIAALAGTAGVAAQLVPSVTDTQARLINAAGDLYRARISVDELKLRYLTGNAQFKQQSNQANLDAEVKMIGNKVQAALDAARALSTQVSALLNAMSVQSSTSAGGSTNISYSYTNETQGKAATKEAS